jgi:hypothetical protein
MNDCQPSVLSIRRPVLETVAMAVRSIAVIVMAVTTLARSAVPAGGLVGLSMRGWLSVLRPTC